MNHNTRSKKRMLAGFLAAFLLGGLILPHLRIEWVFPWSRADTLAMQVRQAPPAPLSSQEIYARAAKQVYKAVVNIDATQQVRLRSNIFDDMMGLGPRYGQNEQVGSGVIISPNGYILTNEHVVHKVSSSHQTITVTMTDGRKLIGHLVGADYTNDVALIKVNAGSLPTAVLGTDSNLVPGQICIAIGNPYNLEFTVTSGVVSALDRAIAMPDGRIYPHLIQHDAPINPGNSGGPLINLQGQVIGINTLVQQHAEGIGFAIPIDVALKVAQQLKKYGHVIRPWLGVDVVTNTQDLADSYGLPNVAGAVVSGVYKNSPASSVGLQPGDVIIRFNGQPISGKTSFLEKENASKIGSKVILQVRRGSQIANIHLIAAEKP